MRPQIFRILKITNQKVRHHYKVNVMVNMFLMGFIHFALIFVKALKRSFSPGAITGQMIQFLKTRSVIFCLRPKIKNPSISALTVGWDFFFNDAARLCHLQCLSTLQLKYRKHWKYFKVNNRNTRDKYEICSKLAIKTPERRHWRPSDVFIDNFEHISYLFLVLPVLALNR